MTDECRCPKPLESGDPRKAGYCLRCGRALNPAWTSNDRTVREFYDRLAEAMPARHRETFETFRAHAEARERAGRPRFGCEFHVRDNPVEGLEEAADGANYALFDTLVARRAGLGDEDVEVALLAAQKFAEAYEALMVLRAKRGGAP